MDLHDIEDIRLARRLLATGEGHALRTGAGLERSEVAALLGCSADAVALWEKGARRPRSAAAAALGRLYRSLAT